VTRRVACGISFSSFLCFRVSVFFIFFFYIFFLLHAASATSGIAFAVVGSEGWTDAIGLRTRWTRPSVRLSIYVLRLLSPIGYLQATGTRHRPTCRQQAAVLAIHIWLAGDQMSSATPLWLVTVWVRLFWFVLPLTCGSGREGTKQIPTSRGRVRGRDSMGERWRVRICVHLAAACRLTASVTVAVVAETSRGWLPAAMGAETAGRHFSTRSGEQPQETTNYRTYMRIRWRVARASGGNVQTGIRGTACHAAACVRKQVRWLRQLPSHARPVAGDVLRPPPPTGEESGLWLFWVCIAPCVSASA